MALIFFLTLAMLWRTIFAHPVAEPEPESDYIDE